MESNSAGESVVGSKDCSLHSITIFIQKAIGASNWSTFATLLGIGSERINKFRQDLLLDKINQSDVVRGILELWVGKEGSDAKLIKLISVLEDNSIGGDGVAEQLRLQNNLPCKGSEDPFLNWSNLNQAFREKVEESISKLLKISPSSELLETLSREVIISLMGGKMPKLFRATIPSRPSYYVNRTIMTRSVISSRVLDEVHSDIFLFCGIERSQLSQLVRRGTSTSTEQLDSTNISERFLILNQPVHFKMICEKAKEKNVHLFQPAKNGDIFWIKSSGGLANLRKFVVNEDAQERYRNGYNFLDKIAQPQSNEPVCISDTPGMGKTILLAELAREMEKVGDKPVFFITMRDFVNEMRKYGSKTERFYQTLARLVCENKIGEVVLAKKLESDDIELELMLDGLDEIKPEDFPFTLDILQYVKKSFKSIRLWITTRPHYLPELEANLNVFGFNIKPFDDLDQLQFLTLFWQKTSQLDLTRLELYAKNVLKMVKSKLNSKDNDIAGIPLQCLLIGEVYEEEAVDYAKNNGSSSTPHIRINSITDLYDGVISKKFEKYLNVHTNDVGGVKALMNIHMRLSVQLLFPQHFGKIMTYFTQEEKVVDLLKVGIMEGLGSEGEMSFIHRTFAEYFVAGFVCDAIKENWSEDICDFFFEGVLAWNEAFISVLDNVIESARFANPVVCYFINALAINHGISLGKEVVRKRSLDANICHACANDNFLQIFKLLIELSDDICQYKSLDANFMLVTVKNSQLEFVKCVINQIGLDIDKPLEMKLFRAAVERGEYSVFDYFLNGKCLIADVKELDEDLRLLLHDCVAQTESSDEHRIKQKLDIVKYLVDLNPELLDVERDFELQTPIFARFINIKLLTELVRLGANVFHQNRNKETVIHVTHVPGRHLSRLNYELLLKSIPKDKLCKLVCMKDMRLQTPLATLISDMDPTLETLELFKQTGADFNAVDLRNDSILKIAIVNGRGLEILRQMIKLGASTNWKDANGMDYFAIAKQIGNEATAQMFNDEARHLNDSGQVQPEAELYKTMLQNNTFSYKDKEGNSLLHLAATAGDAEACLKLIANGLDINMKNKNGWTPLRSACKADISSSLEIIKLLITSGANIYEKDEGGFTFLHAMLFSKVISPSQLHELVEFLIGMGHGKFLTYPEDSYGVTAFQFMLRFVDIEIKTLNLMNESAVDFNATDNFKANAFLYACSGRRKLEVLKALVDFGVRWTNLDKHNTSIFHIASEHGTLEPLQYFLEIGGVELDINGTDLDGDTPLHCVMGQKGNEFILGKTQLLLDNGAEANIQNKQGQTPLDKALVRDDMEPNMIDKLKKLLT